MKQRNLIETIDNIIKLIPDDTKWDNLATRLTSIKESAQYTPPEMMWTRWVSAGVIIAEEIGEDVTDDWQEQACKLWQGLEV